MALSAVWRNALANLRNKYLSNSSRSWDKIYGREYSSKLNSSEQRVRNYVVAGLVKDFAVTHPRILDVGCGVGTLYELLDSDDVIYQGIDMSKKAIEVAKDTFPSKKSKLFRSADFQELMPRQQYDLVIFNEVLYYFRLVELPQVLRRAQSFASKSGMILVSMSNSPKAWWVWRFCRRFLGKPSRTVHVRPGRSSGWKIRVYHAHSAKRLLCRGH